MTASDDRPTLFEGKHFSWRYIEGYHLLVEHLTQMSFEGTEAAGKVMGAYGLLNVSMANPDVSPEARRISLPIEHKADYRALVALTIDSGYADGTNEIVVLYEHRRGLFGRPKPSIHAALYPTGAWKKFYERVEAYDPQGFEWPIPLVRYAPPSLLAFPETPNTLPL